MSVASVMKRSRFSGGRAGFYPIAGRAQGSNPLPLWAPPGRGGLRAAKAGEGLPPRQQTPHPARTSSTPPSPARGGGKNDHARRGQAAASASASQLMISNVPPVGAANG